MGVMVMGISSFDSRNTPASRDYDLQSIDSGTCLDCITLAIVDVGAW